MQRLCKKIVHSLMGLGYKRVSEKRDKVSRMLLMKLLDLKTRIIGNLRLR
jgi:hypothetical protein